MPSCSASLSGSCTKVRSGTFAPRAKSRVKSSGDRGGSDEAGAGGDGAVGTGARSYPGPAESADDSGSDGAALQGPLGSLVSQTGRRGVGTVGDGSGGGGRFGAPCAQPKSSSV